MWNVKCVVKMMIYHGANRVPENFEMGEIKIANADGFNDFEPVYVIAFSGDKFGETEINQNGWKYNGIYSSVTFFISNSLSVGLNLINQYGQGDKIVSVFTVPKFAVKSQIPTDPRWWN